MARHPSLSITDEQEANLRKLAAYLLTLPADHQDFDMGIFADDESEFAHVVRCGTAACAIGHGPLAGVPALEEGETWYGYSFRAFISGYHGSAWAWCFDGGWDHLDPTPRGAARRILHLLNQGVPEDASDQRCGRAPYLFAAEAA